MAFHDCIQRLRDNVHKLNAGDREPLLLKAIDDIERSVLEGTQSDAPTKAAAEETLKSIIADLLAQRNIMVAKARAEGKTVPPAPFSMDDVLHVQDRRQADEEESRDTETAMLSIAAADQVPSLGLHAAAGVIARIRPAAESKWGVDLRLAPTFESLPEDVREAVAKYGDETRAKGVLYRGKVYVVVAEHESEEDFEATILHEIKGHIGLRRLYGKDINRRLNALYASIGGSRGLAELAEARGFLEEMQGYAMALANSEFSDADRKRIIMEELLAHIAQEPTLADRVKAIIGMIRAWLRDNGFLALSRFGETDLLHILAQSSRALQIVRLDDGPAVLMTSWAPNTADWLRNLGGGESLVGDSGRDYSSAQRAMFQRVGRVVQKPTLEERLQALWKGAGKKIAQGMVDQFRPLRDLGGQAYLLARLSKGTEGAIDAFLYHGKLRLTDGVYDADTSGGAIDTVFAPLQGEADDFLWWVAANRADRLMQEDKEHLFTEEDIAAGKSLANGLTDFDYILANGTVTRDRQAIYFDTLAKFDAFNRNALDMAEQSGLIDGDSRPYWEHQFYVPFYRVEDEGGGSVAGMVKKGLIRQQAIKELKGGKQKLNADLLENTLQNWSHLIDAAAKNRAAREVLQQAEAMGFARRAAVREKGAVWYMGVADNTIPAGTMYEENGVQKVSDGTVQIREHGKVAYVFEGEEAPYLLEAVTSLRYAGLGAWAKPLTAMKHWLTVGVTMSPAFKIRNLIRDSIQAIGTSGLSYNPLENIKEGYAATDRATQDYVSMLASGALIRFGTMEGDHSQKIRRLVEKGVDASTILDSENKLQAFYARYLEPAIDAYNELGNRGEEINRAALYKQLIAQGKNHAEASLMARDLMDFSMQGTWAPIRFLTQVVPFMNARLQGLYKLSRAAQEDPQKFTAVVGAVALFSVMLMLAYQDDDDWKKREEWDRDNNWWFKFGDVAFRIPKPFEIGAIGTLAERGVELFASDEMTGKRFAERTFALLADNLAMNPVPQLFKPVIDLYANKDSFTGRPIESMGMERLLPGYRYTGRTSMAARAISTTGNTLSGDHFLSPLQVDHLIQGYFGWLGAFTTGAADLVVRPMTSEPSQPEQDYWKLATAGFVRALPDSQSRYVSQMYDQAKEVEQAYATHRELLKRGSYAEAQEFAQENAVSLKKYHRVEAAKKQESQLNQRIRAIENSDLSAEEKRRQIDAIQRQKDMTARTLAK